MNTFAKSKAPFLFVTSVAVFTFLTGAQSQSASTQQGQPGVSAVEGAGPGGSRAIAYSGRITDSSGKVVADGSYDFTFMMFDASEGGNLLWQEKQANVALQSGNFATQLGSLQPIPSDVLRRKDIWLEVTMRAPGDSSDTVLMPRQIMTPEGPAVPVALACPHSHFSDSWSGNSALFGLSVVNSGTGDGIRGYSASTTYNYAGVYGFNSASAPGGTGVYGGGYNGVYGESTDLTSGTGVVGAGGNNGVYGGGYNGVYGESKTTNGNGVVGVASTGAVAYGVWGISAEGYAGYFSGNVFVSGNLSKASGSFKIDHPLDPANKYLYHSFVESPDMMNIYNGVAVLDDNGEAMVQMPEWFEALNQEFRYQLTAIGAPGPNLYVAEEMTGNRFRIAGGKSGSKVSWQVTGIRHDAYANAHRIPVEEDKPEGEKGTYLHPELFGQPAAMQVNAEKAQLTDR